VLSVGVCEDDPGIRSVLVRGLRQAGHEVVAAHDGREALALLGADQPMDVVVMLLRRALVPVLENAVRSARRVSLVAAQQDRAVRIRVADDGPGIEAATAARLFEPGFSTSGSSGLGLSLARRVARSAGGDLLLARDQAARGAAFDLVVPRG
jgi:signal transduction histidine kinase